MRTNGEGTMKRRTLFKAAAAGLTGLLGAKVETTPQPKEPVKLALPEPPPYYIVKITNMSATSDTGIIRAFPIG